MQYILISGYRDWHNYAKFCLEIKYLISRLARPLTFIVGDAKGVDEMCIRYCKEFGHKYKIFNADWDRHGKAAGPKRNQEMIDYISALVPISERKMIAFLHDRSIGTKGCIEMAKRAFFTVKTVHIIDKY